MALLTLVISEILRTFPGEWGSCLELVEMLWEDTPIASTGITPRMILSGVDRLSVCLTKEAGPLFFDDNQGLATESTNGPETPPLPPYSPNLALTDNAEPEQQKPLRNSLE